MSTSLRWASIPPAITLVPARSTAAFTAFSVAASGLLGSSSIFFPRSIRRSSWSLNPCSFLVAASASSPDFFVSPARLAISGTAMPRPTEMIEIAPAIPGPSPSPASICGMLFCTDAMAGTSPLLTWLVKSWIA